MGERRRGREREKSKASKQQTAKAETSDLLLENWGICEGFKVADGARVSTSSPSRRISQQYSALKHKAGDNSCSLTR